MEKIAKNTICLWYDGDAEEAGRFYAKTFPNSSVGAVLRAPGDYPSGKIEREEADRDTNKLELLTAQSGEKWFEVAAANGASEITPLQKILAPPQPADEVDEERSSRTVSTRSDTPSTFPSPSNTIKTGISSNP